MLFSGVRNGMRNLAYGVRNGVRNLPYGVRNGVGFFVSY